MDTAARNVATLKDAYRQWHDTKGASTKIWLDLMADDVKVRSLAAGRPGAAFTSAINSKDEFKRYFDGLLTEWQMVNYETGQFIAEGERVAMLGSTAWTNRTTGRTVDTPKADFWTFRDGKIVEFYELYDTAALLAAAHPAGP
jgi:ketosteroid isomerase-like protein